MAGEITPAAVMAEVDRIMSARWEWDVSDCCAAACDVFAALTGIDPLAPVRGYRDAIGAARLIQSYGGFVPMASALAAGAALTVSDGRSGDIGISSPGAGVGPEKRAVLICIEPGAWAGKTLHGYAIIGNAERCWRA